MPIDLARFHAIFFEESFEGLDIMESKLLSFNPDVVDPEIINSIFRAAHSIKGASGTFGFSDVSDFTHVMETLLDEIRNGQLAVTQELLGVLLESVDCLRHILSVTKAGEQPDKGYVREVGQRLEKLLSPETAARPSTVDLRHSHRHGISASGWRIRFRPHADLLRTGNEPYCLFRELKALGKLNVRADLSGLPRLADLDPEACYLAWELTLKQHVALEQINEIFAWVESDCELEITPLEKGNPQGRGSEHVASMGAVAANTATTRELSSVPTERRKGERRSVVDRRSDSDRRMGDRRNEGTRQEFSSIRVNIDKIDGLINLVGELVITQSMLSRFGENFDPSDLGSVRDGISQLERNTRELQESVMRIRMLPISFCFNRLPRLVHDLSRNLGKKVEIRLSGEQTEVDKTVLEKVGDPLVHLVRNSLDHGIEDPKARKAAGKPETGVVHLRAFHSSGNIVIEVSDDGAGLDQEKIFQKARNKGLVGDDEELSVERIRNLIFDPGFSTAADVSGVSGRGVGLDVVRRNIEDLGGQVDVYWEQGKGTTVTIRLPLTLAILDGLLLRVGRETYVVSLLSVVEALQISPKHVKTIAEDVELYKLRDEYIPIIRLYDMLNVEPDSTDLEHGLLVVVESDARRVALFVDDLLRQQQVVIKSLDTNYKSVQSLSAATILGDGAVALILDVPGLIRRYFQEREAAELPTHAVA